jgi:hypothetical protein
MMLGDRVMWLVQALIIILQLFVFSLVAPIYAAIVAFVALVFAVVYLISPDYAMSMFNADLLLEPLWWAVHQVEAFFGAKEFRAAPYVGM